MKEIVLNGGQLLETKNKVVYEVSEGSILAYLIPYKNDKPLRRLFLIELNKGDKLVGFTHDSDIYGKWAICISALDKGKVNELNKASDEFVLDFAKKIDIHPRSVDEYDEFLIEKYNIELVKDEGYIYTASNEQKETYAKSLNLIYRLFVKEKIVKADEESGSSLYDAMTLLCHKQHIQIAPFTKIKDSCGRKYGVEDVARLSHFVIREIVLEEKWYKKDAGPILAYLKEDDTPIACIPIAIGRYVAYFGDGSKPEIINEELAEAIKPKGVILSRPFPNKAIKPKDLFFFGFKNVHTGDIVRILLFALIGTLIGLLLPRLNEQIYDKFIPMGDESGLLGVCFVVLACSIGNIAFSIVKSLASFRSSSSMKYSVQMAAIDRLFNLPVSVLSKYDSSDIAMRTMGITQIYSTLADTVINVSLTAFFSLLYLWRMYKYSKKLANWSLVLLALVIAYVVWMAKRQMKQEKEKIDIDLKASSTIHQLISGIAKIRIAGVENRALYEYLKPYTESRRINIEKERMTVEVSAVTGCISVLFSIIFYYMMVKNNINLSVGAFMGFTSAFGSFSGSMFSVANSLMAANNIKPVYEYCKVILDTIPEFDEDSLLPGELNGEIDLNNVTFAYDEETGNIINHLSLHVKPGEYIGIVGSSGCGKSTLLKLLLGFEKPQLGKIYYDNKDIDSLDKRELRKKFGVVLQDGGLIPGSIQENITITAPKTNLDRVNEVLKEVGLEEDVKAMPMGIHTMLSENTGQISGGQKQRVLIARALVGKPKIIFFDEATSALDNVTQAMVTSSLEQLDATRIVIAHRLSTVINCDRILVMDKGEIVEEGKYDELMAKEGLFYNLAIRQIS